MKVLEAARRGDTEMVRSLLLAGGVSPNTRNDFNSTPLRIACAGGHVEVVKVLLADARTNPNLPGFCGYTPLLTACDEGNLEVVRLLLADKRVDPLCRDADDWTPLHYACARGRPTLTRLLLADGRVDLGAFDHWGKTPVYRARESEDRGIVALLEEFADDPISTRLRLRLELGYPDALAAVLYAQTVFLCDGLLRVKSGELGSGTRRFFSVASRLPLELQALLCNRAFGLARDSVPPRDSEPAFHHLARVFVG